MDTEQVVEVLGQMSVMELITLTKQLEDKWGVKVEAIALPAITSACPDCGSHFAGPHACPGKVAEQQTEFTVILSAFAPDKKMNVIKTVRELSGLGLKEAKELVEGAPKTIKENVTKADADDLKTKIEAAGGSVTLQ